MHDVAVLARGLAFPEGPAIDRNGNLYAVEIGAGRVTRIAADGTVNSFAQTGGGPNGCAFGPNGDLYVCNNGGASPGNVPSTADRPRPTRIQASIQRVTPDGTVSTALDAIDGVPLTAPNDCVFDADGGLWFTDPIWSGEPAPISYLAPDGSARVAHRGLRFPNGIGITDDGRFLIACESLTGMLWGFRIEGPGQLGEPKHNGNIGRRSVPDGFCLDSAGRIIVAGHGGRHLFVLDGADGRPVETIELPDAGPTNCCFGGADFSTLYITSSDQGELLTIAWPVPGMRLHPDR